MMRIYRTLIAGLMALALCAAQEPAQPFRADVDVVVAPTVVTDRDDNYVSGLQPSDFRLTDNGKLQSIKVDVTWVPISLVVAVQANASSEPALSRVQKIAPLFKPLVVGDQGEVALVSFDHRIQVLQDFTSDVDKLGAAFQKIKAGSSSSRMIDAVMHSTRMLRNRPGDRRRVLLLISETRDNGSEMKLRPALTEVQFANIAVYSVNMNRAINTLLRKPEAPRPSPIPYTAVPMPAGVPPTPQNAAAMSGNPTNSGNVVPLIVEMFKQVKSVFVDNPQEVLTKWSGGRERSFVTQRDLENAVAEIGRELHSEYTISYTPDNKDEGGFHEIVVSLPTLPQARVRTRPGYWRASKF